MARGIVSSAARFVNNIARSPIFLWLDTENYSIDKFMRTSAKLVDKQDKVLDAGAGACPYKRYFINSKYESCDFENIFDKSAADKHSFVCNLEKIPKKANSYDVIINTQVLEHVPDPLAVLKELNRVLKKDGKLFLTAPQGWGIHGEPYHFFNFTKYGLKLLFEKSGFKIIFIRPRGGFFWYLSKRISTLPAYIYGQYVTDRRDNLTVLSIGIGAIILLPFYIMGLLLSKLAAAVLFPLDSLDKRKDYTLGYECYCIKK